MSSLHNLNLKAMNNLKKTTLILLAILIVGSSYAQISKQFPKSVNLIKMTDPGVAVVGTDDALYGIDRNGKELWKNEKLRKVEKERVNILSGSELVFVRDKGILGTNKVLNVLTGQDYADGSYISDARVIHATNHLWITPAPNKIDVWDINNNAKLYAIETNAPFPLIKKMSSMQMSYTGEKSAIFHFALGQLGEYNLMTGKANWMFDWNAYKIKKPNGDKGDRDSGLSRGFARMKMDESKSTLYFPFREMLIAVDAKNGTAKWDVKANKIGKVRDMYVTEEGVLVLTAKGLQLIDKSSGVAKWDKPIKIKGAADGLMINDNGTFYVISKSSIVEVDIAKKSSKALTEKIKFSGGESFSGLEIFDDVIVLSSDQNVVGINKKSGKILHSVYYKKPGQGLAVIAANVALQTMAAAATANSHSQARANGSRSYTSFTPAMISIEREGSKSNGSISYISTKFKGGDANGFGIARVDKTTGETLDKIVLGERDPIYDVDERNGLVFFKSGKNAISVKEIN